MSLPLQSQSTNGALMLFPSFHKIISYTLPQYNNIRFISYKVENYHCISSSAFYGTRRFEPVTGQYPEPNESSPHPQTLFLWDNFQIILPSTPSSHKLSRLFRFSHQICVIIFGEEQTYKLRNFHYTRFSLASCFFFRLKSKYSPQLPVLKHPQSVRTLRWERLSLSSIQNNRQKYIFVYFDIYVLDRRKEDKRMWTEW